MAAALTVEGQLGGVQRHTGRLVYTRPAHPAGGTTLACQPRGPLVATGGQDAMVRLWRADCGLLVREWSVGDAWVERLHWNHTGTLLAAAAGKGVFVWTVDGALLRSWPAHRATVTDVRWHPSRDTVCATSYGGVTILDPAEPTPVQQLAWQGSSLCARWSPDARYIATGEQDASVHFWIVATGKDLQMTGYPTKIRELAWDRQSRFLATGGGPEVAVWDCSGRGPAGSAPIILPGHEQRVSALAFQRKGPRLVSGGGEGRLVVWQPGAPNPLVGATLLSAAVTAAQWSSDDHDILAGLADGSVFALSGRP